MLCPTCQHVNDEPSRFCNQCGQPLAPLAPLTNKILAQRERLAGERTLVTVLFADLVGYSALSAQVGEEALFTLMDSHCSYGC